MSIKDLENLKTKLFDLCSHSKLMISIAAILKKKQ